MLHLQAKAPGDELVTQPVDLEVSYDEVFGRREEAYQRLLEDAMEGDARRFGRADSLDRAVADRREGARASRRGQPLRRGLVGSQGRCRARRPVRRLGRATPRPSTEAIWRPRRSVFELSGALGGRVGTETGWCWGRSVLRAEGCAGRSVWARRMGGVGAGRFFVPRGSRAVVWARRFGVLVASCSSCWGFAGRLVWAREYGGGRDLVVRQRRPDRP